MTTTQAQTTKYLNANLFEELGIKNVSPEEQIVFLDKIGAVIQQRLLLRFFKILSDDQKKRLEVLISDENGDFSAVAQFLAQEAPNYQKIVEEEIADYKKELISRYK